MDTESKADLINAPTTTLLHGDCLELMKDIPDKSIDAIICDLPYGTTQNKYDIILPFDKLWEQYERIIRQRCYGFIWARVVFCGLNKLK